MNEGVRPGSSWTGDVDLVAVAENEPTHVNDPSLISEVIPNGRGDCRDATTATNGFVVRPRDAGGFREAEASTRVARAVPLWWHERPLQKFVLCGGREATSQRKGGSKPKELARVREMGGALRPV